MIDFNEIIERRLAGELVNLQVTDPRTTEMEKAEAERVQANAHYERFQAEQHVVNQKLLEEVTTLKIRGHQDHLDWYHRFNGTNPADILVQEDSAVLDDFMQAMGALDFPGAVVLSSEEKRLKTYGGTLNRLITTPRDERRVIPVSSGYLIGSRVLGTVIKHNPDEVILLESRRSYSESETLEGRPLYRYYKGKPWWYKYYKHFTDSRERVAGPANINNVFICTDGLLRERCEQPEIDEEVYTLGQWVVTTAINAVPTEAQTLHKQTPNQLNIPEYHVPLVICDGTSKVGGNTTVRLVKDDKESGDFKDNHHIIRRDHNRVEYTKWAYLQEVDLVKRLVTIISQIPAHQLRK